MELLFEKHIQKYERYRKRKYVWGVLNYILTLFQKSAERRFLLPPGRGKYQSYNKSKILLQNRNHIEISTYGETYSNMRGSNKSQIYETKMNYCSSYLLGRGISYLQQIFDFTENRKTANTDTKRSIFSPAAANKIRNVQRKFDVKGNLKQKESMHFLTYGNEKSKRTINHIFNISYSAFKKSWAYHVVIASKDWINK